MELNISWGKERKRAQQRMIRVCLVSVLLCLCREDDYRRGDTLDCAFLKTGKEDFECFAVRK